MKYKKDIGNKYGLLTILESVGLDKNNNIIVRCKCDCGNIKDILYSNITTKKTTSCGCVHKEIISKINSIHNMSYSHEFRTWSNIKARCSNKNSSDYKNYGGRGITICDEWKNSFENFYKDMGSKPNINSSIDRINNELGYSKENCKWSTKSEQARNRRSSLLVTFNNETKPLIEFCEDLNLKYKTIWKRIMQSNWSVEKAFTK